MIFLIYLMGVIFIVLVGDKAVPCLYGLCSFFCFFCREILKKIGRDEISAHEILTVARFYGDFQVNISKIII